MRIFLTGMPGSGKSYWGKMLARELDYLFIDTDQYLEQHHGKSIRELFADGETAFREKERKALGEIIQQDQKSVVIATGGGLPAYKNNIQLLRSAGCVVYISTPVEKIAEFLTGRPNDRPLLHTDDVEVLQEQLAELLASRKNFYELAHLKIESATVSVSTFVEQVKSFLNQTI